MKFQMNRRNFLKKIAAASSTAALAPVCIPRMTLAQSSGVGSAKNLVVVNLLGGIDGLAAFPYTSGISSIINSELRPSLAIQPSQVIAHGNQSGVADQIGFHPSFQKLIQVAGDRTKIVQGYGIPGDPGRSHETCQVLMSLGATQVQGGERVGFLARLMDHENWDTLQYWALADTNAPDTNTTKKAPVRVSDIGKLDYPSLGWENDRDVAFATQIQQALLEEHIPQNALGSRLKTTQQNLHSTVAVVRSQIAAQSVGNNSAGNYTGDYGIGANLRDTAKVLKAKATSSEVSFRNKNMLFLTAQDGYDTHSGQANTNNPDNTIAARIEELSSNLAVFYKDLESFGILDDTIIVLYSEFGRTNYQNAPVGRLNAGTDHGHGNTTMVLGGPIRTGITGAAPTVSELRDTDYNALLPKVDYRDIFSELLTWLNISPESIFTESGYTPKKIGLL